MVVSPCTTFTLPEKVASFFLVAHLERGGFDLDRLIAILRKALHGVGHTLDRALPSGFTGSDRRERKDGATAAERHPPEPCGHAGNASWRKSFRVGGPRNGTFLFRFIRDARPLVSVSVKAAHRGSPEPPWPETGTGPAPPWSDSTRDTPVVMSTISRSPRSTFLPWVSTTAAEHGDEVGLGVEHRGLAGHHLVLLGDDHVASRLQPPDRRTAAGTGGRGLHRRRFRAL